MTSTARLLRIPVLLAASLVLGQGASRAEDRNLKPNYDYVVEVDGRIDKGWQVLSPHQMRSRLLLISPNGGPNLLVYVSEKAVRPVDHQLIMKRPDGSLDILAGAVSRSLVLPLAASGSTASFTLEGRTIALKPRPPLIGPHTVEDLVSDRPNFGVEMNTYEPDKEIVSFLKGYPKPTEIEVFFGSWCSVCEAWVPKFLKSLEASGNAKIQVHLIGVSREFQEDQEIAKKKGIRGIPTFIIRQEGVEVGRIVGAPEKGTVEGAVAEVLRARS